MGEHLEPNAAEEAEYERRISHLQNSIIEGMIHERAHRMIGDKADTKHLWLGIPVIILATIVGTSAFSGLVNLALLIST